MIRAKAYQFNSDLLQLCKLVMLYYVNVMEIKNILLSNYFANQ